MRFVWVTWYSAVVSSWKWDEPPETEIKVNVIRVMYYNLLSIAQMRVEFVEVNRIQKIPLFI